MRYWAPLPIYVLAFCQMLAGSEALSGYLVYVGLILFFGALSWLFIGVKKNRPVFGAFLGVLWFLCQTTCMRCLEKEICRGRCPWCCFRFSFITFISFDGGL